ncbi:MAG: 4-(cytidine 5'-diphospho)-2-C-methyl-D-erythritol kinase [Betaproteobacteria bacterium HGW-Betaproteobacteria-1]|nr:MAG: 4-(cytidine 5'-diphospho)-2-C-methyl-D-erythritol kinase [Betaproteobacteria bacterium HGW-Betaproteobacteria-1]
MSDHSAFQSFAAPAKINLFLHVTGRRADGYHELQTVFRLLDFHDTLHIRVTMDGKISRSSGNSTVAEEDDLVIRAARLLQQHSQCSQGAEIAIEKRIPMGGGLGGGSSDAASTLLALNHLWQLGLRRDELQKLGVQLGADVPVFIFGRNAWAEGIGDQLQAVSLEPKHYLVITPAVHVSTAEIFTNRELTRNTNPTTIAAFSREAFSGRLYSGMLHNDLESVVFRHYPAVAACMTWLSSFAPARMSGSGASVFAEFASLDEAKAAYDAMPEEIAGTSVAGFTASSLEQHPLYGMTF